MRVLLVDDNKDVLEVLGLRLGQEGYSCRLVTSKKLALQALRKESFDAIVTDYYMPNGSGADLLKEINKEFKTIPVIVISGIGDVGKEVIDSGASRFIQKPWKCNDILMALEGCCNREIV